MLELVLAIAVAWLVLGLVLAFVLAAAIARNERASRARVPHARSSIDDAPSTNGHAKSSDEPPARWTRL